jgi:hypothetical protein
VNGLRGQGASVECLSVSEREISAGWYCEGKKSMFPKVASFTYNQILCVIILTKWLVNCWLQ